MPDNKKLDLTDHERNDALEEIARMKSQISFMDELLRNKKLNHDEAACHMNLIRQVHDSLAGLLHTDVLSASLEESNRMCREANARVHELEKQLGQGVTTAAAMARLKQCEDWFQTWYQMLGWDWMKLEWSPYGLRFETSVEVNHPPVHPENHAFGDKQLAVQVDGTVPYEFLNYDLKKDTFHDSILDTQANHGLLKNLFARTFPGSRIHKFESHADGEDMLLRAEGSVPWESIEKWHDAVLKAGRELNAGRTGKLYVEKAEIASRLASRTYTSHADKKQISEDRSRLEWLRFVTALWEQAMAKLDGKDRFGKDEAVIGKYPDDTELVQEFPAGTGRGEVCRWFDTAFGIDHAADLEGASK